MGLIRSIKNLFKRVRGVTYIETMIAISILSISMVYIAVDSRFLSKAIYQLNEKDNMLYAAQAAVERYKLELSGTDRETDKYSIIVDDANDPLISNLKKVTVTVHLKNTGAGISDFVMVSYVFSPSTEPPGRPEGLVATAAADGITLNWDAAAYTDTYTVKRSTIPGGPSYTVIASGITSNSYTDTTAETGTTYYYVVTASNAYGNSPNSNEASATIIINQDNANIIADSYVRGGFYAWNNYGTDQALFFRTHNQERNTYKSYLKFDLSAVSGNIIDAKLRLYGYNSSGGTMNAGIYQLSSDSWTENGITWSNAPEEGNLIASVVFDGTRKYVEANVTGYCTGELAGDRIAGFVIKTPENELGDVNSREEANLPELVVTWTPLPPPPAPQNLTAVPDDRRVSLSWETVIGAASYNIKRSNSDGGPYTTIQTGLTGTGFNDTGLTNGTTYYYVVAAVNGCGESTNSNQASATPNILTTVTYNPEADAYVRDGTYSGDNHGSLTKLEVKNAISGSDEKRIGYCRFNLTGLRGDIVNARLRLYGSNTEDWSETGIGFYDVTDNSWGESSITFGNKPELGSKIGESTVNNIQTYRDLDVTSYIRAETTGDKSAGIAILGQDLSKLLDFNSRESLTNKPELVVTKTLMEPLPPDNLTAIPDDSKVNLIWTASDETDSYTIKRSTTDGGPYTTIASGVTSASYTDSPLTNGTTYYYVVSSVNASGESDNSEQEDATPNTTITVTFNPDADARVESFYSSSNYGTASLLGVVNDGINNKKSYLRFNLAGYTQNTVISATLRLYGNSPPGPFEVKAFGVSNNSWIESGAGGICWSNAPALEAETGSASIGTVQQYYDMDVTPYVSSRADSSSIISLGVYTDVVSGGSASINSRESASGKPQLVVKMVEGVPKPPKNLVAVGGNRLADLSWSSSDGVASYKVKRASTSGGPYTTRASGITGTTYRDTGLTNGTDYYYVVSAVNAKGESEDSNEACAIPSFFSTTYTLLPADDTYVRNGAFSTTSFGDENVVYVSSSTVQNDGNTRYAYLKYDLSSLPANPSSATLMITGRNITNNRSITINIYKVTNDSWDQYAMNWNNAPGNDIHLGSFSIDRRYRTRSLSITSYARTELSGDKKVSICIKTSTYGRTALFSSNEGSDPPLLQIVY